MSIKEVCEKLNEQQATIITLKERLEKINGGYGDLTHRKGLTANEWLIQSQEKELKKKDKQISEWIEQHSKDIVKISEQNKLIQELKEENERLDEENATLLSERIKDLEMFEEIADKLKSFAKENKKLKVANLRLQQRIDDLEKKRRPMRWSE